MPAEARHWGVARKAVNLFLRDCFYNIYLRRRFNLEAPEAEYEIPLDRIVAEGLGLRLNGEVPRWRGVGHLSPEVSRLYQTAAKKLAQSMGISRVHLDIYLWTERPEVVT
jgi:hypothetical protein